MNMHIDKDCLNSAISYLGICAVLIVIAMVLSIVTPIIPDELIPEFLGLIAAIVTGKKLLNIKNATAA